MKKQIHTRWSFWNWLVGSGGDNTGTGG